jgi:hypothetical protein
VDQFERLAWDAAGVDALKICWTPATVSGELAAFDKRHRAVLTPTRGSQQSFRPSWAPDGTRIVFTRFTPTGITP